MKKKKGSGVKFFGKPLPGSHPDDAPELLRDFFRYAEIRKGDRVIRRGRPPVAGGKQAVNLRIDRDILEHYRRGGPGWQTRINETLRRSVSRKKSA